VAVEVGASHLAVSLVHRAAAALVGDHVNGLGLCYAHLRRSCGIASIGEVTTEVEVRTAAPGASPGAKAW
jgi:hypothetical protein